MELETLFNSKMGVCVKDLDQKIVFQNDLCKGVCGKLDSVVCKKGCMSMYLKSETCAAANEGAQLFSSRVLEDGKAYDIIVLNDGSTITTLLYPLGAKHDKEMEFLEQHGLSKREAEIMQMLVRGATNSEVAEKLGISRATLKTHLNNIYKKLPSSTGEELKRQNATKKRV